MTTQSIEGAMPPLPRKVIVAISGNGTEGRREYFGYDEASMHAYAKAYAAPLLARVAELEEALDAFIEYDDSDDVDGIAMMNLYATAVELARAALAAHKEQP